MERLGANASVQHAQHYWDAVSAAARLDGLALDPVWVWQQSEREDEDTDEDTAAAAAAPPPPNRHHPHTDTATASVVHPQSSIPKRKEYYSLHTAALRFTASAETDRQLHRRFRSNLGPYWNVQSIPMKKVNPLQTEPTPTSSAATATAAGPSHTRNTGSGTRGEHDRLATNNATSFTLPPPTGCHTTTTNNMVANPLSGDRWTSLLLACDGVVPDFNFLSLLRMDCVHDPFWNTETTAGCDNLLIVPRAQFVCIELARCREGHYDRPFRRQLELFDVKTACEDLERAVPSVCGGWYLSTTTTSTTTKVSSQSAHVPSAATAFALAKTALTNLATQWPHPSSFTLKQTQAVSTLRGILKNLSVSTFSHPTAHSYDAQQQQQQQQFIHTACADQLQRWHDTLSLGRISRQLNTQQQQQLLSRMAKATLTKLTTLTNPPLPEPCLNGTTIHEHATYVSSRTTGEFSDLIVEKSPASTAKGKKVLSPTHDNSKKSSSGDAANAFRDFGVVVWPSYCAVDDVQACRLQCDEALRRLQSEQLTPRGLQVDGKDTFDFIEVRQRPGHRVDNRYTILDDPTSPIARLGQKLKKEVASELFDCSENYDDWRLLYAGVVHAFPRQNPEEPAPPPQLWHRDGPSLFAANDNAGINHPHHSTHCFNVFVPLIDVNKENGATEFVPGTHEDARYDAVAADVVMGSSALSKEDASIVRVDGSAGTVIVFDVRVMHRGLSNQSLTERPMLYFTFCRDWFQEKHMFQKTESLLRGPDEILADTNTKLCRELYRAISGKLPDAKDGVFDAGHPHYTTRVDLILMEQFANEALPTHPGYVIAKKNSSAVLQFANLSSQEKNAICLEWVSTLESEEAWKAKKSALESARKARKSRDDEAKQDFASIQTDMSDVTALYKITAQLLFHEKHQISKLGFSMNDQGICTVLSVLKLHATSTSSGSVTCSQLEECFTSWWHASTSRSRFELISFNAEGSVNNVPIAQKKVLVVFSSLGSGIARPEWQGTLRSIGALSMDDLDVLHVMDFAFSWYCQDPTCEWKGGEYFEHELRNWTKNYQSIFFLGDSMGATGALRFSQLAKAVLAFTPQIDVSNYAAVTRSDFSSDRRLQLKQEIIDAVTMSKADISIHFGSQCQEDVFQVSLLPTRNNLLLTEHDYDDHVLSLHLRQVGRLSDLVKDALGVFLEQKL